MAKCKICGLFREQDIEFANEAKPDFVGFVFSEKSKRFVDAKKAELLKKNLLAEIVAVGVFVNAKIDFIHALYKNKIIEVAQLHGGESDEYIEKLKDKTGIKITRVIAQSQVLHTTAKLTDYILLDSHTPGSGKAFDWKPLKNIDLSKNIFLAGGVNLGNISSALELNPFAIDVSSGAETNGIKDREKIFKLVEICRQQPHKG
jgi:phosphoribosylanthranilate isomerase